MYKAEQFRRSHPIPGEVVAECGRKDSHAALTSKHVPNTTSDLRKRMTLPDRRFAEADPGGPLGAGPQTARMIRGTVPAIA